MAADPTDSGRGHLGRRPWTSPISMTLFTAGCGFLLGVFEITNTSIGWHLASSRWMLAHRAVLRADPFSFTAIGTPWIDHEWLFQVLVALTDRLAGPAGLVLLRALVSAMLALVLFAIWRWHGLAPPPSSLLAVICLWGARPRLFVRPELATLLLLPVALWLVVERPVPLPRRLALLAALLAVGANLHGGILVAGPLIAAVVVAQLVVDRGSGRPLRGRSREAIVTVAVAMAAPLANPFGWCLWTVPFRLAHLVGQPHVPNPEWRLATPTELPGLYLALVLAVLVMVKGERRLDRWLLLALVAALAIRHVRNLGLFFVVLPVVAAPAFATVTRLGNRWLSGRRESVSSGLAVAATGLVVLSTAVGPWPRWGFGYAADWYPKAAVDVLEHEGLDGLALYNDVRFGGYLIDRRYPDHQVFIDDRNEIHERLLAEIHTILTSSGVARWQALLDRYDLGVALVRYHPPILEVDPAGRTLGLRGFSALWFPAERWALVYWDDVAMLLVRRKAVDPELLRRREYRILRPDDLDHLAVRLAEDGSLLQSVREEAARAVRECPQSRRAWQLADRVGELTSVPAP